ncbi:MAG: site-specific DNA-methyltransferase [Flavobacterium sp.]|uniref:site-specific DNA-methyltransferase n=1 Tax=Flavobacterium sp. TaxID=239 RepID=UPI0037BD7C39
MAKKDYSNLTKDQLLEVIEKLEGKKKYGLVWDEERVPEKVVTDCQDKLPVLTEVKGKEITTDESEPTHILIEGDNYHALSVLNYTHKGKIDLIYIDPPYNTGNKDFIYNDKYVEKEDTWRHSKWLTFMSKRLELAKELLTEKGVIFISIDDNEIAQLKLLCDGVFGEGNFAGQWHWFKSATPPNLSHKIKKNIEFVLAYEKQKNSSKFRGIKKISKSDDPITKPQNSMKVLTFPPKSMNIKLPNKTVKPGIYGTEKYPNKLLNELQVENGTNKNEVSFENRFVWTQGKLDEELASKTVINCSKTLVISYKKQNYSEEVPPNLIDESVGVDTTEEAGKRLFEMFGEKVFDYPKPVSLIKYLLNFKPELKEKSLILDFFAGTGTTAQAVLELNSEDNGNRKFIVCTNNENEICEKVTLPRINKVIKGYKISEENEYEGLGNNLKYFKTSFVANNRNKDQLKIDITKRCTEMLCLKEGIFNLIKEEKDFKIFQQGNRFLAVYYDFANASLDELKEEMNALKGEKVLYCFTVDNHGLDKDNFRGWKNIRLEPIPQKILDVYKRIFKN